MKKTISSIILIFGMITITNANTFNFLRDFSNARSSALAGSVICIDNDLDIVIFNPATLNTVYNKNISVTFLKHALDINSGAVQYLLPYNWEDGKFSISALFTNYGSFDYVNKNGVFNGTFSANDLAIGVTYSNILDTNLQYGLGFKFIYSNIEKYHSTAVAIDAGLLYKFSDERTNIAASFLNVGTQLSTFDGVVESIPNDLRIGFNHKLKGMPLLFNLTFVNLAEKTNKFFDRFKNIAIGGEFNIGKYIDLRVGYSNYIRNALNNELDKGLSGFSAGLGLKSDYIFIDYGASVYSGSLYLHRFTLKFNL